MAEPISPQPITVGSKSGTVVYIDHKFHAVSADDPKAVYARVLFDDGSTAFYAVEPRAAEVV